MSHPAIMLQFYSSHNQIYNQIIRRDDCSLTDSDRQWYWFEANRHACMLAFRLWKRESLLNNARIYKSLGINIQYDQRMHAYYYSIFFIIGIYYYIKCLTFYRKELTECNLYSISHPKRTWWRIGNHHLQTWISCNQIINSYIIM